MISCLLGPVEHSSLKYVLTRPPEAWKHACHVTYLRIDQFSMNPNGQICVRFRQVIVFVHVYKSNVSSMCFPILMWDHDMAYWCKTITITLYLGFLETGQNPLKYTAHQTVLQRVMVLFYVNLPSPLLEYWSPCSFNRKHFGCSNFYWNPLASFGGYQESRATFACLYRTSGRFYMHQHISVDSRDFTQPELRLRWSDLQIWVSNIPKIPKMPELSQIPISWIKIGYMLIKSAQHSLPLYIQNGNVYAYMLQFKSNPIYEFLSYENIGNIGNHQYRRIGISAKMSYRHTLTQNDQVKHEMV